jgi:hypothetical protein
MLKLARVVLLATIAYLPITAAAVPNVVERSCGAENIKDPEKKAAKLDRCRYSKKTRHHWSSSSKYRKEFQSCSRQAGKRTGGDRKAFVDGCMRR